jgi:hypothetical protein
VLGGTREHEPDSPLSPNIVKKSAEDKRQEERFKRDSVEIVRAAQTLSDDVQEILCDTTSLQENMTGFHRLLLLFDKRVTDISADSQEREDNSLDTLLLHLKHPQLAEICNEVGLPTTLVHALRLLRMYEIRLAKSVTVEKDSPIVNADEIHSQASSSRGITFTASERLCSVFSALMLDPTTTEKIRQSLAKLVTFPLSILPKLGVHLQIHSSAIISSMCEPELTLQQVFFLHEAQAVTHMVRHLGELISTVGEEEVHSPGYEQMLRGESAETAGMWLTGVSCLVDVVTSTLSALLMDEFEAAGGKELLLRILEGSRSVYLMPIMSSITRLYFNPQKDAEYLSYSSLESIFVEFIKDIYGLKRTIDLNDDIESLMTICNHLVKFRSKFIEKEYIIQNIGYLLLTIYSSDHLNFEVLDTEYYLLSMLILSLPALNGWDTMSAVLTTLNYVCQCVDTEMEMPIISLCAATVVMTRYY